MAYDFGKLVLGKNGKIVGHGGGVMVPMTKKTPSDSKYEVYEDSTGKYACIYEKDSNKNYINKIYCATKDTTTGEYYLCDAMQTLDENTAEFSREDNKIIAIKTSNVGTAYEYSSTFTLSINEAKTVVSLDYKVHTEYNSVTEYNKNDSAIVREAPLPIEELNGSWYYSDGGFFENHIFVIDNSSIKYCLARNYNKGDSSVTCGGYTEINASNTTSYIRTDNAEVKRIDFTMADHPGYDFYVEIYKEKLKFWVPEGSIYGGDCEKVPDVEIVVENT